MTKKGVIVVSLGLTVYALAVLLSIAIVMIHGTDEGNGLPALVLTAPLGCVAVANATGGDRIAFAILALLGAAINGGVFFFVVRRFTRTGPRAEPLYGLFCQPTFLAREWLLIRSKRVSAVSG